MLILVLYISMVVIVVVEICFGWVRPCKDSKAASSLLHNATFTLWGQHHHPTLSSSRHTEKYLFLADKNTFFLTGGGYLPVHYSFSATFCKNSVERSPIFAFYTSTTCAPCNIRYYESVAQEEKFWVGLFHTKLARRRHSAKLLAKDFTLTVGLLIHSLTLPVS